MIVALIVIWSFVLAVWYYTSRRHLIKLGNLLPGPPGYPIIGNALTFWGKPEEVFKTLHKISMVYKRMMALWLGPSLNVIVYDAKDVEAIMKSRKSIEKADEYKYLRPWLGDCILLSSGAKFKRNKKLIVPSFHISNLRKFLDVFNTHAEALVQKLHCRLGQEEFDALGDLNMTTMGILLESALGLKKEILGQHAITYADAVSKLGRLAHMRIYKFWLRPDFIFRFSSAKKTQDRYLEIVNRLTNKVIRERKALYQQRQLEAKDEEQEGSVVLDSLIGAKHDDGTQLTDEEIKDEVMNIMFAGQDTTTVSLGFILSLLGVYQHIQDKVLMEVDEIFGDSDRPVTTEDISKLQYLERVIQETWRLYPPIPMIAKKSIADIQLDTHVLPKGCTIPIILMNLHRNPNEFPRPHRFDPDNFLPERIKSRNQYSFIPFSAGQRTCVGAKYAMVLIKVVMSTLLRNYRVHSRRQEKEFVLAAQTVLKRKEGFLISLESRKTL